MHSEEPTKSIEGSIELEFPPKIRLKIPFSLLQKALNWIRFFGKKNRKILLIGGGEIGTEIGLAALRATTDKRRWLVRAIVNELLPPIANLLYYYQGIVEDCCVQAFTNDYSKIFQFVKPHKFLIEYIAECITIEKPDIVLLEDAFMSAKDWKNLFTYLEDMKYDKIEKIQFIPSPKTMIKTLHRDFVQSDIFLDKQTMKEFLETMPGPIKLLGKSKDKIKIESLEKELAGEQQLDHPRKRIQELLAENKKLVFKLAMTSSGYGQFVLSNMFELSPEFFSRMNAFQKLRVENEYYLIEKYVVNKREACTIISQGEDGSKCIDGIFYTKYDPERYPLKETSLENLQGTVRLLHAETKKNETVLWHKFRTVSSKIQETVAAPFLYVEFILDEDRHATITEKGQEEDDSPFYVNEISYRPDDAGFISRISHEKSQFDIFVNSLERIVSSGYGPPYTQPVPVNLLDTYCCYTLIPDRTIQFKKEELNHQHGVGPSQVKFRLYEKTLSKSEGDIPVSNRRIIGYLMHHNSEDGSELLKTRLKNLGLSAETIIILVQAVERTKEQLQQKRRS